VTGRTKLLGVDYGSVRVGLSISDPDHKFAFPLSTYERRDPDKDAAFFRRLVEEEQIAKLIVGLPLHLDGREGEKAKEARVFGEWLASITSLPVVYFDERFTTVEAESALWAAGLTHRKRKQRRDTVAAQILLQTYIDAGCPETPVFEPLDVPMADTADD
jgi:putative Holliday junction resolvase